MATTELDESASNAAGSVNRLRGAADRLTDAFGGLFTGAPKTISGVTSALNGLIPGVQVANSAIQGFEGYVGVLQGLSNSGIHFNNQIDEMILQAGAANMQIGDLARVVASSSEQLAQLGAGANQGLQGFLAAQGNFYARSTANFDNTLNNVLEQRLKRLGMTVDDINDRFLRYDMISAVSNVTERTITAERNRRATEFAEEMDRLAKLTGKQADELAVAVEATAREGRVFAATQLLPESVRTQFASDITGMAESYGPAMANFMKDIVTQGFPAPDDPAMLAINSFAPELGNTFAQYNALMKQGKAEEARLMLQSANNQIERLRTDENFLNQVRLSGSGASVFAAALGEVSTQLNSSVAVSRSAIEARLREAGQTGPITDDMINAERRRIEDAQRNQQRDAASGSARVFQGYIDNLTELQRIARITQEETVRRTFTTIENAVQELADNIRSLDIPGMVERGGVAFDRANDTMFPDQAATGTERTSRMLSTLSELSAQFTTGSEENRAVQQLILQTGDLLAQVRDQGGTITTDQQTELNRIRAAQAELLANLTSSNPDHGLPEDVINRIRTMPMFSEGTMGSGSLFRNFGQETIAALHGLEAVTTPDQMAAIVRSSSSGTMEALVDQFTASGFGSATEYMRPLMERGFSSNMSTLNGMLNTVRTQLASSSPTPVANIDLGPLEKAIMNLPAQFKQPVEEALNSSLKPAMEAVAANTSRGAEYSERTFKNTRGINQDYMRGA